MPGRSWPRHSQRRSSSSSRSSLQSCSSRSSTSSSRSTIRSWPTTCVGCPSAWAFPFATCSSPTRAGGRRSRTRTCRASGPRGASCLYDTLLQQMKPAELRAVLAHELAHRKHGDVARLSAILVAAAVGLVVLLWAVLGDEASDPRRSRSRCSWSCSRRPSCSRGSRRSRVAPSTAPTGSRSPRPATSARSRGRSRGLVDANVADLDPPRVVYYLKYTHPTVVERLDALRQAARDEGLEAA